ncbi:MAG: peptide deformylase [Actinomycetota bacterium]
MAVRPIVRYPEHSLKEPSQPFSGTDEEAAALILDLVETMRASPVTVGLAAPQIGVGIRAFVLDVSGHRRATSAQGLVALLDPILVSSRGAETVREGCLSVPDLTANVGRATEIEIQGRTADGEVKRYEMDGFEARAALHELDHLDGLLILDRVASAGDIFARKVYGG